MAKELENKPPSETTVEERDAVRDGEGALLLVSDLGWTKEKAAAVRASLMSFEEEWDAVGTEDYDQL